MVIALLPLFVISGLDIGGRVGMAIPASGLERNHNSTAVISARLGYGFGRSRFGLDYCYAGFAGREASPYRLDVHEVAVGYGFEFVHRPEWGFEAALGAGMAFARRSVGEAIESGRAPAARFGIGFVQHQGKSRLTIGLDNSVFIESGPSAAGTVVSLSWVPAIGAGVAYVF